MDERPEKALIIKEPKLFKFNIDNQKIKTINQKKYVFIFYFESHVGVKILLKNAVQLVQLVIRF